MNDKLDFRNKFDLRYYFKCAQLERRQERAIKIIQKGCHTWLYGNGLPTLKDGTKPICVRIGQRNWDELSKNFA